MHNLTVYAPGHFSGFFCCREDGLPPAAAGRLLAGAGAAAGAGAGGRDDEDGREGGPAEGGRVVDDAGLEGVGASKSAVASLAGDMARNSARRALNFFLAFVSR